MNLHTTRTSFPSRAKKTHTQQKPQATAHAPPRAPHVNVEQLDRRPCDINVRFFRNGIGPQINRLPTLTFGGQGGTSKNASLPHVRFFRSGRIPGHRGWGCARPLQCDNKSENEARLVVQFRKTRGHAYTDRRFLQATAAKATQLSEGTVLSGEVACPPKPCRPRQHSSPSEANFCQRV